MPLDLEIVTKGPAKDQDKLKWLSGSEASESEPVTILHVAILSHCALSPSWWLCFSCNRDTTSLLPG